MTTCVCEGLMKGCPLCGGSGRVPCERCLGTRYVAVKEGEGYVHAPCSCSPKPRTPQQLDVGLPKGVANWTLANMRQDNPDLVAAKRVAVGILAARKGWLFAHASPGRGKTYILCAMVRAALDAGMTAMYRDTAPLLAELVEAMFDRHPSGLSYNAMMRVITVTDVLCLDEFGVFNDTGQRLSALREILDNRADKAGWSITAIATNSLPDEIEKRYPWLMSRLQDPEVRELLLENVPNLRAS